jgi:hypothetical protein
MKKTTYILIIAYFCLFVLPGCEGFLDMEPQTSKSLEKFSSEAEIRAYLNQFYSEESGDIIMHKDGGTDNQGMEPVGFVNDNYIVPSADGNWTEPYANIRTVNILLENNTVPEEESRQLIGEAYFWRAWQYFNLLKRYGGVPLIKTVVPTNDEAILKTPRSSRSATTDFIIEDLDKAIEMMNARDENRGNQWINKDVALAFKSRAALYEGTWEKYHAGTEFGIQGSNGSNYLKQAVDAAQILMNSGRYGIWKGAAQPYTDLFIQEDLSSNREVIWWKEYNLTDRFVTRMMTIWGGYVTKNFVDAYLGEDGTPIAVNSGDNPSSGTSYYWVTESDMYENRDPRLVQTILLADDIVNETLKKDLPGDQSFNLTLRKYYVADPERRYGDDASNSGEILFRYAEVLLNFLEAKAELEDLGEAGYQVTDGDIDATVKLLRDRVGWSSWTTGSSLSDFEKGGTENVPLLKYQRNTLTGSKADLIHAIRRERRVELICEGFRWDDLMRWKMGDFLRSYVNRGNTKSVMYEINETEAQKPIYYYDEDEFSYNVIWDGIDGLNFKENKSYLYPIPFRQIQLADYEQNPGWE